MSRFAPRAAVVLATVVVALLATSASAPAGASTVAVAGPQYDDPHWCC